MKKLTSKKVRSVSRGNMTIRKTITITKTIGKKRK
jgi:hypothetical protein